MPGMVSDPLEMSRPHRCHLQVALDPDASRLMTTSHRDGQNPVLHNSRRSGAKTPSAVPDLHGRPRKSRRFVPTRLFGCGDTTALAKFEDNVTVLCMMGPWTTWRNRLLEAPSKLMDITPKVLGCLGLEENRF